MRVCFASRPEPIISRHRKQYPTMIMQAYNAGAIEACLYKTSQNILSDEEQHMVDGLLKRLVNEPNVSFSGLASWLTSLL